MRVHLAWSIAVAVAAPLPPTTLCQKIEICTMVSGLECNRSGGLCPPCLYPQPHGVMCFEKQNPTIGCPQLDIPLLEDCDQLPTPSSIPTMVPTTITPQSTKSQSPISTLPTSVQPVPTRNDSSVVPSNNTTPSKRTDAEKDMTTAYLVAGATLSICLLVGLCCVYLRKSPRLHPNDQSKDHLKSVDSSLRIIYLNDSLRGLETTPPRTGQGVVSLTSSGVSIEEDDILSTVFMRFRTTNDYAFDERYSSFSMLSSDSHDTISTLSTTSDDGVEI